MYLSLQVKQKNKSKLINYSFFDYNNDPDFIPVSINKESLVEQSIVTQEMRDRFTKEGQFCFRIPGTWERDGQQEKILLVPRLHVFEADDEQRQKHGAVDYRGEHGAGQAAVCSPAELPRHLFLDALDAFFRGGETAVGAVGVPD